jgi:hypothetical protein
MVVTARTDLIAIWGRAHRLAHRVNPAEEEASHDDSTGLR